MCYDVPVINEEFRNVFRVSVTAVSITVICTVLVLLHYRSISADAPQPTTLTSAQITSQSAGVNPNQFSVASDTPWETSKGTIYPYSFSAPTTLALTTFPNDKYDMYAIVWKGQPADQNVLMGVDNLTGDAARAHFINEPKINYVREWYKQFGLKGVSSIEQFTNSKGLTGYRAIYFNSAGASTNVDVFFEVPSHPEYVIHFASGILAPEVFNKILDSVDWQK
jgi:hypothetical protein